MDIKGFRKANKISQEELAKWLNVNRSFIAQVECGYSKAPEGWLDKLLTNPYHWDTSALSQDSAPAKDTTDSTVQRLTAEVAELKAQIKWYQNLIETLTKK